MRQDNGFGDGDAELAGEGVVEELIVGTPPERIVDDDSAAENGVLQVSPIKLDVMRDAINDDAVATAGARPF